MGISNVTFRGIFPKRDITAWQDLQIPKLLVCFRGEHRLDSKSKVPFSFIAVKFQMTKLRSSVYNAKFDHRSNESSAFDLVRQVVGLLVGIPLILVGI